MATPLTDTDLGDFPEIQGGIGGVAQTVPMTQANFTYACNALMAARSTINTLISELDALDVRVTVLE